MKVVGQYRADFDAHWNNVGSDHYPIEDSSYYSSSKVIPCLEIFANWKLLKVTIYSKCQVKFKKPDQYAAPPPALLPNMYTSQIIWLSWL